MTRGLRAWLLFVVSSLVIAGCGGGGGGDNGNPANSGNLGTADSALPNAIVVSPGNLAIPQGLARPFRATGTYADGTSRDITGSATWSSSDSAIATVSPDGVVAPVGIGSGVITATVGGVTGSSDVTVNDATLTSLVVTPGHPAIPSGLSKQFSATATYSTGISYDVTSMAEWSSSATTVASIDNSGTVTANTPGIADVTASFGSLSAKATLSVSAALLETIAIDPIDPTVPAGAKQQFTAQGTYTDGTSHDITAAVAWSTGDITIASAGYFPPGAIVGGQAGTTVVTATLGNVSVYTTLTVTPATLQNIAVLVDSSSMVPGATQQLIAEGIYSDGSGSDITNQVSWSSSNTAVATVAGAGLVSAVADGTADITAALGSISGVATVAVAPATLLSIEIDPSYSTLAKGLTSQFTATGNYSDGSRKDITSAVTWSSSYPSTATINNNGIASALDVGYTTIAAALGSITSDVGLYVGSATALSLTIKPASPTVPVGLRKQFTATATFTDGTKQDVTSSVTWSSGDTSVVTVASSGLATMVSQGTATISASFGHDLSTPILANATITVGAATIQTVKISPSSPLVANGASQQFTAQAIYSDNSTQDVSSSVTWSSGNSSVAGINSKGLATVVGVGLGSSVITATYRTRSGSTTLTTSTVAVTPNHVAFQIDPGHSGQVNWNRALSFPSTAAWHVDTGAVVGSPLIANGRVFILSATTISGEEQLIALDETNGQTLWGPISISSTYVGYGGMAYDDGKLFVLNSNGLLMSFDAASGQAGWSVTLEGQSLFTSPPVASNGLVYAKGAGPLVAVDESSGAILWSTTYWNGTDGSPAVAGNSVYLTPPCEVDSYDRLTGQPLWTQTYGCSGGGGTTPVVGANNVLFEIDPITGNHIFDATTGALLGTFPGTTSPVVGTDNAYVMGSGTLQSLAISNQKINWSFAGDGSLVTPAIAVDSTLFIGSSSGKIYAIDAATGGQLWSTSAGAAISGSGLAVAGGYLIVPTETGVSAWQLVR